MAHNSLPHNLTEVCNAIIHYIENENITIDELISYIPGPDFPLDNIVINQKDVKSALKTGHSTTSLKIRGRYMIDRDKIIFTSIPYRTYRDKIREQITKNIDEFDKIIDDFNDESSLGENRLIFKVKAGVEPERAVLTIFKLTDLQTTVSYNMNYIVNGTPKLCSMIDLIEAYYKHQTSVLLSSTIFDKEKAEKRLHILQGLKLAVDKIDAVIALIRGSNDKASARIGLMKLLGVTEIQANAVLDMKLSRLTKLDAESIDVEIAEKQATIDFCNEIIENKKFRDAELIKKITEMKNKYGDARRTELCNIEIPKEEKEIEQIEAKDVVVIVSKNNTIKKIPKTSFRTQKRNGTGIKTNEDIILSTIKTNTIDHILLFSNKGKMYKVLVDDIPDGTNVSRGSSIANLVPTLDNGEIIVAAVSLDRGNESDNIVFLTKNGLIKKTALKEYKDFKRKTGIIATKIKEGDAIADIAIASAEDIIIATHKGMTIRISLSEIPYGSRVSIGVKGIKLNEEDEAISLNIVHPETKWLGVIYEDGLGKKVAINEFPTQKRDGKGILVAKDKLVAGTTTLSKDDAVLICSSQNGICISETELPELSRQSIGNILIKNGNVKTIARV